jgi:superfamily I DNA/RNA helicase
MLSDKLKSQIDVFAEERRLRYVAVARAKKRLWFTWYRNLNTYGIIPEKTYKNEPSIFPKEIVYSIN